MHFYLTNVGWSLLDTTVLNERNNESRTGCKLSLKNWNKRNIITILLLNGNMEANSALSIIFYHAISWSIKSGYKLPESYILRMLKMNIDRWYIIGKLYGFHYRWLVWFDCMADSLHFDFDIYCVSHIEVTLDCIKCFHPDS